MHLRTLSKKCAGTTFARAFAVAVALAAGGCVEPSRTLHPAWASAETNATYSVVWGDYDNDGDPDLAVGNKWGTGHNQLYRNDGGRPVLAWTAPEESATESDGLAWADWDGDGDLDLAVGNDFGTPNQVYASDGGSLTLTWTSHEADKTIGVAWGDWDNDGDPDLAVANAEQPNRLYENTGGGLRLVWTSKESDRSEGLAWGDWDGDGDLDLAFGNFRHQPNRVYENTGGGLVLAWSSPETDNSLSVAWGDWDGDGDLDLAVGNEGEPNRVYENTGGDLVLSWTSVEKDNTRAVAWGDWDNDGDPDLAVGNEGQPNRVFRLDNYFVGDEFSKRYEKNTGKKPDVGAGPDAALLMGGRFLPGMINGNQAGDWNCRNHDHWLYEGTGMKEGDVIKGMVGLNTRDGFEEKTGKDRPALLARRSIGVIVMMLSAIALYMIHEPDGPMYP